MFGDFVCSNILNLRTEIKRQKKFINSFSLQFKNKKEERDYGYRLWKVNKNIVMIINFMAILAIPFDIGVIIYDGFNLKIFLIVILMKIAMILGSMFICITLKKFKTSIPTNTFVIALLYIISMRGIGELEIIPKDSMFICLILTNQTLFSFCKHWYYSSITLFAIEILNILIEGRGYFESIMILLANLVLSYFVNRINRVFFHSENKSKKSLKSFQDIIKNHLQIGIWVIKSKSNKISFENTKAEEIVQISNSDQSKLILSPLLQIFFSRNLKSTSETMVVESKGNCSKKFYTAIISMITYKDKPAVIITFSDITEQKALQLNFQRVSEAKDSVIASVSHDIRTPLNSIISMNEAALEESTDPSQKFKIMISLKSAKLMLYLITDFLDFYKVNSATPLNLILSSFTLRDVLNELVELFFVNCNSKGIELRVEIEIPANTKLTTDELKFKRVLINLISNALKYTKSGHITIRAKKKIIETQVLIEFSVEDTGIGIREEDLCDVFTKYQQISNGNEGDSLITQHGIGLGLTISTEMVKLLNTDSPNKEILLESKLGIGSKFTFYLPYSDRYSRSCNKIEEELNFPNEDEILELDELTSLEIVNGINYMNDCVDPEFKKFMEIHQNRRPSFLENLIKKVGLKDDSKRILIVEDEETNILVMKMYLGKITENFKFARNGQEAFDMVISEFENGKTYDLIFMDINMPVLNGYKSTLLIREFEKNFKIKPAIIVALTANIMNKENYYEGYGFNHHYTKPITYMSVYEILRKYGFIQNN